MLSDGSDADSACVGVGGELLDDLTATNETISTKANATAAMMIRLLAMVRTRADFWNLRGVELITTVSCRSLRFKDGPDYASEREKLLKQLR
jgi:hypothetical protein